MACGITLATALVACWAIANAVPSQFPRDRTLIYNYYGDVKAGIIEPAQYASQYALAGQFYIKPDTSDPSLSNAFVAGLTNVKIGLHNGLAAHYEPTRVLTPIPEPAKAIEKPFLIVYTDDGQFHGVKVSEDDPGWSKNMKLAIASMLQLDLGNMKLNLPIKPHSFMSKENTIHGDCWTSYDVHSKFPNAIEPSNEFIITKFGSPRNCTNYNVFVFNHVENEGCDLPPERPVNMASRRVVQAEKRGEDLILIKSLIAHGGVNYFPWRGRSESHYVLNNASFVLDENESPEITIPVVDFTSVPLITDISYQKPQGNYAEKAGIDITQGRHSVAQSSLITKVKKMLEEAADYLEEDHLEAKEPDFKHGQTMNRILHTMTFLDVASFDEIYTAITSSSIGKDLVMQNIFLGILPQVGTHASSIFIKNLILEARVDYLIAIEMLTKLPLNVRNPTEELLREMEPLFMRVIIIEGPFDRYIPAYTTKAVRKAAILSFASLTFRTFKNSPEPNKNELLNKYLDYFYNNVITGNYDMRMVALMALRNIQVGRVFDLLAPVIRGDIEISEDPLHVRLLAIWAVERSIPNYQAAHDLLWPIMADYGNHLKLRIAAYDILMRQAPTMANVLHLYWFMVYEKNEHLYSYHHTTIKGIANSVDPCDMYLKELTTKIMRFTRIHSPVPYKLSASYMTDAIDEVYGHGDRFSIAFTVNEQSGHPEILNAEHSVIEGRKRSSNWKIQLIMDGVSEGLVATIYESFRRKTMIPDEDVRRVLEKASKNTDKHKSPRLDLIVSYKGRVIIANHYSKERFVLLDELKMLMGVNDRSPNIIKQFVSYDAIYEQQVISEMGLPVVLESRIPVVTSIKGQSGINKGAASNTAMDLRIWRHGDYSMSIYNPFVDVWHAIRRSTATDIQLPIKVEASFNVDSKVLEVIYPRLPVDKYSKRGVITHAKDCTTVTEDENDTLKRACPTCAYHEVVTKGISSKRYHQSVSDIKDTGLQYTKAIFDCENGLTPVLVTKDIARALYKERKNAWADDLLTTFLAYRQHIKNILLSPRMGSCGVLYKQEPSIKYPTSHVKLTVRGNVENIDHLQQSLHILGAKKINLHGTYEAIAASTNTSARTWDFNMNLDMSQGHKTNTLKVQLTRLTPSEKNLKICIDATKTYPNLPDDPLRVGVSKEETNAKVIFSMAETDDDKCSRDGTLITMTVKGELTDEQKKKFTQENISGACSADMKNPLYKTSQNLIPKTVNCLDHALKHTTLRKYTINVAYAKIPQYMSSALYAYEDEIKALFLPHIDYTTQHSEPGSMRIGVEFPLKLDNVDIFVVTPSRSYDIIDAEVSEHDWMGFERDPSRHEGFGPDPDKHLWMYPLDNTRFSNSFVKRYKDNKLKLCSIYTKVITTVDGGEIPYVVPDDWTLASGDNTFESYAIFVKNIDDKMAVKLFAKDQVVEINPSASSFSMKVNNELVENDSVSNGTYVPIGEELSWAFKITFHGPHVIVEMKENPVTIIYTVDSLTLMIDNLLQGKLTGLCGNMDGTHKTKIPNAYRLVHVQ